MRRKEFDAVEWKKGLRVRDNNTGTLCRLSCVYILDGYTDVLYPGEKYITCLKYTEIREILPPKRKVKK